MKRIRCLVLCLVIAGVLPALAASPDVNGFASKSFDDRQAALDAFVKAGSDGVPALTTGLSDKRAMVRMYSAKALGYICDASSAAALLKAARSDGNAAVRAEAALALGGTQSAEAAQELLKICGLVGNQPDTQRYVRLCAAQGICRSRTKQTMPAIIALLKHPDDGIPPIAATTLQQVTYQHFGTDYKKWKQWWTENKDTFKVTQAAFPYAPLEK